MNCVLIILGLVSIYKSGSYFYDILYHRIEKVLEILQNTPTVPTLNAITNCTECQQWDFIP